MFTSTSNVSKSAVSKRKDKITLREFPPAGPASPKGNTANFAMWAPTI